MSSEVGYETDKSCEKEKREYGAHGEWLMFECSPSTELRVERLKAECLKVKG